MAICSIIYGVFFIPSTAWCPVSRRSFTGLGVLVRLGLAGVGLSPLYMSSSHSLTIYVHVQDKLRQSGGRGNSSVVSHFS
jgi:hypothetical protein